MFLMIYNVRKGYKTFIEHACVVYL